MRTLLVIRARESRANWLVVIERKVQAVRVSVFAENHQPRGTIKGHGKDHDSGPIIIFACDVGGETCEFYTRYSVEAIA